MCIYGFSYFGQCTPCLITEEPSEEEKEVCRYMHECMALRDKYIFRERIPTWEKEEITDPSTPKANPYPFQIEAEPASSVWVYEHAITSHLSPIFYVWLFLSILVLEVSRVPAVCHQRGSYCPAKNLIVVILTAFSMSIGWWMAYFGSIRMMKVSLHFNHTERLVLYIFKWVNGDILVFVYCVLFWQCPTLLSSAIFIRFAKSLFGAP